MILELCFFSLSPSLYLRSSLVRSIIRCFCLSATSRQKSIIFWKFATEMDDGTCGGIKLARGFSMPVGCAAAAATDTPAAGGSPGLPISNLSVDAGEMGAGEFGIYWVWDLRGC